MGPHRRGEILPCKVEIFQTRGAKVSPAKYQTSQQLCKVARVTHYRSVYLASFPRFLGIEIRHKIPTAKTNVLCVELI